MTFYFTSARQIIAAVRTPKPFTSINLFTGRRSIMTSTPKIISSTEMSTDEAKWISLKKITYTDAEGKQRLWECAERKTRKSTGVDAVAILSILRSKTNAFPLSTVVIEQYRPPIGKFIIELPAGLIDEGETPEEAAIRELEEETGYKTAKVIESSPIIVSDPGMTNANMKLVTLDVVMEDKLETPEPKLDPGEFIVTRVVQLDQLSEELKAYDRKGFVVDAKLSHFAFGYDMALRIKGGELA
ncbi:NUDIX hydrolase domain-like protein [Crucibulum laeve]|uniref:NUDIX hydrolase domain-like protein n=1 Tax=Crucibulum laeve TaxID=68775 RepID=A0A5C3MDJ8_9AGAR|nr:NUDIX hydrolase domain-like protein [Crucibulum laeve]